MRDDVVAAACAACVSRRQFLAATAAGGALVSLAACAEGPTIPKSSHLVITVGDFPGLATIGTLVKVGSTHAAKRTGADTFVAYSMYCTHEGCATFLSSQKFVCPCHGSQFDNNGAVLQGPADKALAELPTAYNAGTDTLTIN